MPALTAYQELVMKSMTPPEQDLYLFLINFNDGEDE